MRSWPADDEVLWRFLAEDLQCALLLGRPLPPRPGAAAQVGVVEVGQPVGGARTSRRIRRSSQASTLSWAPSLVSIALMASPSLITTRSTPRTSLALDPIFSRLAAPTMASAASGPGQVTSSDIDRPGSVSEPWARKAPRQAASQSQVLPATTCLGRPRTGRPLAVHQPGLPGEAVPVLDHPHYVAIAFAQPARSQHDELGCMSEDLRDVLAQPARGRAGVEFGLDHDATVIEMQSARESQQRRDLCLAAAWLEHADAG